MVYFQMAPSSSLFGGRNVKTGPDRATGHVGGWNLVKRHIFKFVKTGMVYFLMAPFYRDRLFYGRNAKMGPDLARSHVGHWNLVQRHIFWCVQTGVVHFWMAPSIGIVCLVAELKLENGPWQSQEPCRRLKLGPETYFFNVWRLGWFIFRWHHPQG